MKIIYNNFYFITYFILSLFFTKYYYLFTYEYYPPANSLKVANFEADKVFQKRFLIPVISKYISKMSKISFDKALKLITVFSVFLLLVGFNNLLKSFLPQDLFSNYWSLLILAPISWNYFVLNSIYHAYDIPCIMFYCVCLHLFLKKRFYLYYILFIFATFNRESTCFITISLFLICINFNFHKNFSDFYVMNKIFFIHCLFQLFLWFSIVFIISSLIENCPGETYEYTYPMLKFLEAIYNNSPSWPYLDIENFFSNPRCFLTIFLFLWIPIPFLWKSIPSTVRKLLLLIPIYLIPAFLYGNLMETRVYHELNIIVALALLSGILHSNSKSIQPN